MPTLDELDEQRRMPTYPSGVTTPRIKRKARTMKNVAFIETNYTVRRASLEALNEHVHGKDAKRPDQPVFTGEGWYRSGGDWILIRNPFADEWQMLVYGEDPREEFQRVADLPEIP